ncbi:hypothetical protein XELAEV_18003292mg [Xenopus laevis]|nr:hypothetical protein XELAEV_18003292mg [Xenopus laevis]
MKSEITIAHGRLLFCVLYVRRSCKSWKCLILILSPCHCTINGNIITPSGPSWMPEIIIESEAEICKKNHNLHMKERHKAQPNGNLARREEQLFTKLKLSYNPAHCTNKSECQKL